MAGGGVSDEALQQAVQLLNVAAARGALSPKDLEGIRSDVLLLLPEFTAELAVVQDFHAASSSISASSHVPAPELPNGHAKEEPDKLASFGDAEWLTYLELKFVLRSHRMKLVRALGRFICGSPPEVNNSVHISVAKDTLSVVEDILGKVHAFTQARLKATDPSVHPLVLRLASRYGLSAGESDLFQLLFVAGASKSAAVRAILGIRQEDKEIAMELCEMSLLEVEDFLDDKRPHIAEGIIVVDQDKGLSFGKTIRMNKDAVSVLLWRPLKTEQRLKFSKTELLNILEASEESLPEQDVQTTLNVDGEPLSDDKPIPDDENHMGVRDLAANVGELDELLKSSKKEKKSDASAADADNSEAGTPSTPKGTIPVIKKKGSGKKPVDIKSEELTPYTSSLEYLDDSFQELAWKLQIAKARHKEDMKEALNDERPWYAYSSSKVSNLRELNAKLRFAQNRLRERMKLTEKAREDGSAQLPRLEALAQKLSLDEFEKGVVVMLAGISISPVLKSIFEAVGNGKYRPSSDSIQVKDILIVFFDSFKEQVLARTHFYKSSRLVARGLIKLRPSIYSRGGGGDLMDQSIELDRRILDWIVGLDSEMNELVDGSHMYKPKIKMDDVVLPKEQKDMLLRTAENFANFKKFRKTTGLEDLMSYGAGLVVLLCGPSGTGKTMTVNAVAHHLGKRVLLVDFQSLHKGSSSSSRDDPSADLRGLFRDADMNDAIIFFDECESIFAKRERGGDKLLSSLLTEMERHEGIIVLATNRPLDLDEAMHRRITCVSEFYPPDHKQRREIWTLASEKLPVAEKINWDEISLRYELTGGYIKNALVGALLTAISRDSDHPTITEGDIVEGCRLQMRGSLQMKTFQHRVVPKTGLEDLILTPMLRKKLEAVVTFEKARGVLLGQWGFQIERIGTACLFWGPSGTGKSSAAKAIGFELGRPLKVINCAQLVPGDKKTLPGANITAAFRDSQLMDAVLVLDDFQIFWSQAVSGVESVSPWSTAAIGLLLHELSKFPGICILIANNVQGSVVHRIDPEMTRRLKFLVEFKWPDEHVRTQMWKKMIPNKCPLAPNINFPELGRRFDFTSGAISSAIVRGAAKASLRNGDDCVVTYTDLYEAGEIEQAHYRDEISELLMSAYI